MINITCYSTQYARGCLYSKKVKLLMMSSLKLETCRVKDD